MPKQFSIHTKYSMREYKILHIYIHRWELQHHPPQYELHQQNFSHAHRFILSNANTRCNSNTHNINEGMLLLLFVVYIFIRPTICHRYRSTIHHRHIQLYISIRSNNNCETLFRSSALHPYIHLWKLFHQIIFSMATTTITYVSANFSVFSITTLVRFWFFYQGKISIQHMTFNLLNKRQSIQSVCSIECQLNRIYKTVSLKSLPISK